MVTDKTFSSLALFIYLNIYYWTLNETEAHFLQNQLFIAENNTKTMPNDWQALWIIFIQTQARKMRHFNCT